jgi:hypothetical protein
MLEGRKIPKQKKTLESRFFENKKRVAWGDLWGLPGRFGCAVFPAVFWAGGVETRSFDKLC